jgi:acetyl-CoA carboxylase carboxyl transferase subunit alpha
VAGIGSFRGQSVAFVGHQKGRDLKERTYRNFGMPRPEGYRKAMRVFELANRLGFPVVTLIDTPGAYPGVGAEQRGQSGAIARSQLMLMGLNVPVVACVIGEGSSGGALAIGVADRVLMQQNTIYTVISPEGCAAILWKDAGEARRAAVALQPTAESCLALGVVDAIIPEPSGGAHRDHGKSSELLADAVGAELEFLGTMPSVERRRMRREKFERMGAFTE